MISHPLNKIIQGDVLEVLKTLLDASVHCIVTSPPYYRLRDYGLKPTVWPEVKYSLFGFEITIPAMECCLGLEPTPHAFVGHIVLIFREAKRVLRNDGTLWLNIGDSYAGGNKKYGSEGPIQKTNKGGSYVLNDELATLKNKIPGVKQKDIIGIPWMIAFALRDDGWYLRQDIIWHKPNPMPESVTDRCTKAHEYIFLLSKSSRYYYDHAAIMQPVAESVLNDKRTYDPEYAADRPERGFPGSNSGGGGLIKNKSWNRSSFDTGKTGEMKETYGHRKSGNKKRKTGEERGCPENTGSNVCSSVPWEGFKANKRSVWTVTTKPFSAAHFATFPEDLITDCVKAGSIEGGVILDPFMGAGTTALVASKLNRNFIGIELNPAYIKIAEKRLQTELGMFNKLKAS